MVVFRYSGPVLERFPAIVGGVLHARGVAGGPPGGELRAAFAAEQQAARARIDGVSLASIPSLAAWRRVFSGFGVEPTRYRSAAEALLRRLAKQGELPSLGTLVDIGNLVSIRYALPVAVFDLRATTGTTTVRFADGGERFTDLGSGELQHPDPGEVVFVDDAGLVKSRRWCWRQSAESAAGERTDEILVTVEGHHETAAEDVAAALADLIALLDEHRPGAEMRSAVLSASDPALELA